MLRHFSEIGYEFTDKQMCFLHELVKTGSSFKAYCIAYDPKPSASRKTITVYITRLRNKWYMKAALEIIRHNSLEIVNEKMMDIAIDAAWVLKRTALLADFNIRKFVTVDENGNAVYNFKNATDEDWYCISEYTVDEISKGSGDKQYFVDRIKLKTVDKIRALELVGRHIAVQAWSDKLDLSSKDGSMTPATIDASTLSPETLAELMAARSKMLESPAAKQSDDEEDDDQYGDTTD